MIGIPKYIQPYANNVKISGDTVSFALKCTCGCDSFALHKNTHSTGEKEAIEEYESSIPDTGFHTIHIDTDKDGKPYAYIKKFFFFKKYLDFPDPPYFTYIHVVKAICESCKQEITIFDNRFHGYDSLSTTEEQYNYVPHYSSHKTSFSRVMIKLEHLKDLSQPQDEEECYDYNEFGWIGIYKISGNKKILYFDEETA